MKKYCLALDLKDDEKLIAEYERHHQQVWEEISESIQQAGITSMQIFRTGPRLFMIMETDETFSFEQKAILDSNNKKVMEWEQMMLQFQQPLKWAIPGEKWVLMKEIFTFKKTL